MRAHWWKIDSKERTLSQSGFTNISCNYKKIQFSVGHPYTGTDNELDNSSGDHKNKKTKEKKKQNAPGRTIFTINCCYYDILFLRLSFNVWP